MILFGDGPLPVSPGMGRDYYDDNLPGPHLQEIFKAVDAAPAGGEIHSYIVGVEAYFGGHKPDEFYEGMLSGILMVVKLLIDLSKSDPSASLFYGGLMGVTGVQAGIVAKMVLNNRQKKETRP